MKLSKLIDELYPDENNRPKLIGPDVHGFHDPIEESDGKEKLTYMVDFADNCSELGLKLHALTHHEYIEISEYPQAPPNSSLLDITGIIASEVNESLSKHAPGVQIWA